MKNTEVEGYVHGVGEPEIYYHALFEQATDAIMLTDFEGNFKDVNAGLCNMFGYSKQELLQMNVHSLFDEDHIKQEPIRFDLLAIGEKVMKERKMVHKDGSLIYVEANAKKILENRILSIVRNVTRRKVVELELRQHEAHLEAILEKKLLDLKIEDQKVITRAVLKAQEIERNKIGQELHDNVNQLLSSIRLYLSMLSNNSVEKNDILDAAKEFVDLAINEIRALSREQVTPARNFNFKDLIEDLCTNLNENTNEKTVFQCKVDPLLTIEDDLKLNIYRIVQEQTHNILKYAHASKATLSIHEDHEQIHVLIEDNGQGFNPLAKRKGIGLSNMINRVESYNGKMKIDASPGHGCKIEITIPIGDNRKAW